jgi:hypothetical protein
MIGQAEPCEVLFTPIPASIVIRFFTVNTLFGTVNACQIFFTQFDLLYAVHHLLGNGCLRPRILAYCP